MRIKGGGFYILIIIIDISVKKNKSCQLSYMVIGYRWKVGL